MSELSVGDKVIFKCAGYRGLPIQVFKVVGVSGRTDMVIVLDKQEDRSWLPKTRLIKVGSYG